MIWVCMYINNNTFFIYIIYIESSEYPSMSWQCSASFYRISPHTQHNLHSWTSLTHHLWHYHVCQSLVASLSVSVTVCLCLVCLACAFSLLFALRASLFVRSNDKNVFTLIEISCAAINRCQSQQYLLFFLFLFFVQQNNEIEMQISINLCNCDRRRFSFLWVTWQALLLLLLLSLREKWNSCDY